MAVCVMFAAFFGVAAGGYVIRLNIMSGTKPESSVLIKKGQSFPDHILGGLDGKEQSFLDLIRGKKTIAIFITTECPHCELLINKSDSVYQQLSRELQLLAISFETVEKLRSYRALKNMMIPLYNDKNGRFTGKYKIDGFPTLVGIDQNGRIRFVEVGNRPDKSIQDYFALL